MKLLKVLGIGTGSTYKTVSKSFKSIDKLIEAEHITGTIDKAKEFTGDIVEKAGNIYEKSKMKVEELKADSDYKPIGDMIDNYKEKIVDMTDVVKDKLDDISEEITEFITHEEE